MRLYPSSDPALDARIESWPITGSFTISRGAKTQAVTVAANISSGGHIGRGECVPYLRYGETPDDTCAAILAMRDAVANGLTRQQLQQAMPPGAARNAIDCAMIDLASKQQNTPAWQMLAQPEPRSCITAFTISLGTPEAMAAATANAAHRALLKIKLGSDDDISRLRAVRQAAPKAELIVDANEGWTPENLAANLRACADAGVTLVEQPLPAENDMALAHVQRVVPVCADESIHGLASLASLRSRYDAINIKLDKTGGLTEAIALADAAEALGFDIMIGCMVATSLSMAPAMLLASRAKFVDLDGPLLLARDIEHGLRYDGSHVFPPTPALWG